MTYTIYAFSEVLKKLLNQLYKGKSLDDLSAREKNRLDSFVWFIYNLHGRKEYLNETLGEYTSLHSRVLAKYLGAETYKPLIDELEKWGVVKRNKTYSSGRFPMSYAIVDEKLFLAGKPIKYHFTKKPLVKKLLARKTVAKQDPFLNEVYMHVSKYSVRDDAQSSLDKRKISLSKYISISNQIESIHRADFSVTRDDYGRVYNAFVFLPKVLRKSIVSRDYNEPMNFVDVDIAACLPFVFGALVLEQNPRCIDCKKFMKLAVSDDFYQEIFDFMQYELQSPYESFRTYNRDFVKKEFLTMLNNKPVLNKGKELYSYLEAVFPKHAQYLNYINRDSNKKFHKKAMKIETKIMVTKVFKYLIEKDIDSILIHDGVLVREEHVVEVISMIKAGFSSRFDIEPHVRAKAA